MLSQEEVETLRVGLKQKWDIVNKEYQMLTHKSVLDTVGLRKRLIISLFVFINLFYRKENCEKELTQIEKDLEKLNKGLVFVDASQ